jgi:hypothetical protein
VTPPTKYKGHVIRKGDVPFVFGLAVGSSSLDKGVSRNSRRMRLAANVNAQMRVDFPG